MAWRGFAWWWGPSIVWAAILFALSSIPGRVYPRVSFTFADKVVHVAVYAVLAWLCARSLHGPARGPFAWRVALTAIALAIAYGVTDEVHQIFVPGRSADPRDVVADAVGAVLGVAVFALANRTQPNRVANRVD